MQCIIRVTLAKVKYLETVAKQTICTERPVSSALLRFGLWDWSTRVGNWGATPTRTGQGHHQWGTIPQRLSWVDRAGSVAGPTDRLAVSDPAKGELTSQVWGWSGKSQWRCGNSREQDWEEVYLQHSSGQVWVPPDPCAWVGSLVRLLRATNACWCLWGSDNRYLPWLQGKVLVLWWRPQFHCKIPMASGWWGNAANCKDQVGIFSCRFRGVISSEDVNWHSFVDHKTAVKVPVTTGIKLFYIQACRKLLSDIFRIISWEKGCHRRRSHFSNHLLKIRFVIWTGEVEENGQ